MELLCVFSEISDVSRIGITCVQNTDAKLKGKYCKQVAWKGTASAKRGRVDANICSPQFGVLEGSVTHWMQ
jgi:hypothetical protein